MTPHLVIYRENFWADSDPFKLNQAEGLTSPTLYSMCIHQSEGSQLAPEPTLIGNSETLRLRLTQVRCGLNGAQALPVACRLDLPSVVRGLRTPNKQLLCRCGATVHPSRSGSVGCT